MWKAWALVVLAAAGCYAGPDPIAVQQQRDAEAQSQMWRDQQAAAQRAADSAEDARDDAACRAQPDANAMATCMYGNILKRHFRQEQRWHAEEVQRQREQEAFDRAWREKEAREARRQRIGDAIQAGGNAYVNTYQHTMDSMKTTAPKNCSSMVNGNLISTTCY